MTQLLKAISPIPIAFGGAAVSGEGGGYGFGSIGEGEAISLLQQAFERGLRIFDSAPIYGYGLSEKRIGKAFKQNREEVFLVSKSGVDWHPNKRVNRCNDAAVTQKMLEQSLRDLDSDYIDLYMVHWPDEKVDIRVPMEVLAKAKLEGKIKHIGLCNTNTSDLEKAFEVDRIEVAQSQFHLLYREPQKNLFKFLNDNKMSFMSWGTLDKGVLTKRVDKKREQSKEYDDCDARRSAPWWN
ncbi:MAG: hypothetical protein HOM21_15865, partial [Halobacteriovoraceae bacterium]|nr:hypothetical protein [Halobacteriovoraceae bacterium]